MTEKKTVDHVRVASLRLMLADSDARDCLASIDEGRPQLAKVYAEALVNHIKKLQEDLRAAQ